MRECVLSAYWEKGRLADQFMQWCTNKPYNTAKKWLGQAIICWEVTPCINWFGALCARYWQSMYVCKTRRTVWHPINMHGGVCTCSAERGSSRVHDPTKKPKCTRPRAPKTPIVPRGGSKMQHTVRPWFCMHVHAVRVAHTKHRTWCTYIARYNVGASRISAHISVRSKQTKKYM